MFVTHMKINCIGCGVTIQTTDPKKLGYLPATVVEKRAVEEVYCQRCFRIKHYDEISKNDLSKELYLELLQMITKKNGLFLFMVDLFDFESSFSLEMIELLKEKDVILVGNKLDVLPKSLKPNKITLWLRHRANLAKLEIKDCQLISTKNKYGIDELIRKIDRYRMGKDVYLVGTSNVGKSSALNAMLRSEQMVAHDVITTSSILGTTIDLIKIPFFHDNKALVDTPGLIPSNSLVSHLAAKDYNLVLPLKEIKSRIFQLNAEQSLVFGGYARVDFLTGEHTVFVVYASNEVALHRTKLSSGEGYFEKRIVETWDEKPKFVQKDFQLKGEAVDLVIAGLCFIKLTGKITVRVTTIEGVEVRVRKAFIGH